MATTKTKDPKTTTVVPVPRSGSLQPILVVLLIVASFLLGALWTEVRYLKRGVNPTTAPAAGTAQPVQQGLTAEKLPEFAKQAGVDQKKFTACLDSEKHKQRVEDQYQSGVKAGINGTPGTILLDTKTGNTRLISGAVPFEQLKAATDELLSETGPTGAAPIPVDPVAGSDYVRGNRNARIAMIEYSDLQCPFCKQFHPTAQRVIDEYKGQVLWVYRHFPLDQLHPIARKAAEGSECVGELAGENGFWKYVDAVFKG